jgi:hypothetical protein
LGTLLAPFFSKFVILSAVESCFRGTFIALPVLSVWQPKIRLNINRPALTLPARMKSNTVTSFESPCGRHSSFRSMFYWKRISKSVEMEQRDLQRFYRTSKRELNNSKEKNCKTGGWNSVASPWTGKKDERRGADN